MARLFRTLSPVAVAVAAAGAVLAVLVSVRGPVPPTVWVITATSVVYLPVVLVGSALVRSAPRNPVSWLFLVSGVGVPLSALTGALVPVLAARGGADPGWVAVAMNALLCLGVFPLAGFGLLLFPDGRIATRAQRVLARLWGLHFVVVLAWSLFGTEDFTWVPGVVNPIGVPAGAAEAVSAAGIAAVMLTGPLVVATAVTVLRRARRAEGTTRQGLLLAAVTGFAVAAAFLACAVVGAAGGDTAAVGAVENLAVLAVGIAAWAGIVRYGLFDVRLVLSRSLTYALLVAAVVAVYLVTAAALDAVLGELTTAGVATALAVVVAMPLREWLGRMVRVRVYGLRDEPGTAFARLGERLTAVGAPSEVLPVAARTVAEALRLPYVAIEVDGRVLATAGDPRPGATERLALPYAGETVGTLVVQRLDDRAHPRDDALLDTLVQQVAVAARAVSLADNLQRSREHIVNLREDERRRLRRDLHDGLGPTMAGIALGLDLIARDPATTEPGRLALRELRHETEKAVADVRRIVYGLRPPVLDELGLAAALAEQAARLAGDDVTIDPLPPLPPLPAAVEVAAYRIAVEAVANAVRHAPGCRVRVAITVADGLDITVTDDGPGIPTGFVAGVGITSMRERAAELGGTCAVRRGEPGTVVTAHLPLTEPPPSATEPDLDGVAVGAGAPR
jgi:two-component system NarL family sensor kinase